MPTFSEPGSPAPAGEIPLCVPEFRGNEWKFAKECLDTGWVSSAGSFVSRFEEWLARYVGARHAVAVTSGTAALHVALLVAGIQPEEEVLVPTLTFVAPVNAVRYVRAFPVFVDAEPTYWQMDPQKLVDFLERECSWVGGELRNRETHRRVRAILPVDVLGHPVDMDPILQAARKYDLVVVEDATESLGSTYKERKVGSMGDICCLSFNGNKIITTGGGGMVLTDRAAWSEKARYLTTQAKDDAVEYVHNEIGFNYRLTNIQAAVGCAQVERLPEHLAAKRRIAAAYRQGLSGLPGVQCMVEAPWAKSNCWLSAVLVDDERFGMSSRELMRAFTRQGIQTRPLWRPAHLLPPHRACPAYRIECAERLHARALCLPSSVGLRSGDQERVVSVFRASAGARGEA